MKHYAGLTAGVFALAAAYCGSAVADGMPRRAAPPPPPPVVQDRCAPGPWTGFYVGGNIGWAHNESEFNDHNKTLSYESRYNSDDNGFTGGLTSGYNLQCGNVVFGIESDINWVGSDNDRKNYGYYGDDDDFHHSRSMDWFGTLRGRIGWANDRMMIYATGGLAYGDGSHKWGGWYETNYHGDTDYFKSSNDVNWGWTAGGGIEFLHSQNFTIKAEALWIRFDNDSKDFKYTYTDKEAYNCGRHGCYYKDVDVEKKARFGLDDDMVVVRLGLNYKFGDRTPVYEPLK